MIASEIPFPHQLRPLSYAQQLDRIVTRVLEEESHLLDAQEDWPWIDGFLTFNDNNEAKSDLFRLLNRKPGWLRPTTRAASTSNTAVLVIAPALQSQAPVSSGADWVETQGPNSLEDWLLLLSRPEVYDLARKFKIPIISSSGGGGGVDKMREAILTYSKGSQRTLSFSTSSSSLESLIIAAVRKYESAKHVVRLNPLARDAFHRLLVVANKELEWPEGDKFLVSSILSNLKSLPAAEENEVEDEDEGDGAVLGDCQDLATNETSSFPPSRALRNNQLFFFPYTTSTFSLTFPSRSDLLEYIKYLKLERKMLDLMEITRKSSPSSLSLALDLMHSCIPEWKSLVAKERELVNSGQGCGGHISGIPWMVVYTPVYVLTRILHRGRHLILDMSDSFSSSASLSSSNNKPDRYKALASHLRMLLDQKYFLQSKQRGLR